MTQPEPPADMPAAAVQQSSSAPVVGGCALRIDSYGKVTGQTRYVGDIRMEGMLHAAVLRSPRHHARLVGLDVQTAAGMDGVMRILTAADIPGLNGLDGYSRDEPVLTPLGGTLRQKGAPIALVIAESQAQARQAARAIQVEYEILPHVFDAAEALADGAPQLYPNGNVLSRFSVAHGDLEAAFNSADLIVETEYQTALQEHAALEPESALGYIDEAGRVTVVAGTHEPHWQVDYIAQMLAIPPAQIRVIMPPTGGSFGSRQDPWPLAAAGLMAFHLRRPVSLVYNRQEVFEATPKRHPYHGRYKIGVKADGRLTAIQARIETNTGGYDSAGYWISNYAVTASGGAYSWQAVDVAAQTVYTNLPKCGQFRGFGSPQSAFFIECTLDEVAERLKIDPLEFRLKNCLEQDQISFLGYRLGESLAYREVLEAIRPGYHELLDEMRAFNCEAEKPGQKKQRLRMGVGFSGMWYRFGKSGSLRVETWAELALDGHFTLYCSAPDYGQGSKTAMAQIAAQTLGVERNRVELVNADTALTPDSGIQGASRATYFIGGSVQQAMENLKSEILAVAAEMLDHDPSDLRLKEDGVSAISAPQRRVSLNEAAQEFERLGKSRRVIGVFDLSPQFPQESRPEYLPLFVTGAQAAQVIVDLETGGTHVTRVIAAHDVGKAINPIDAVGQIQGAILMGIGTALSEEMTPGLTTGFSTYILPMVDSRPRLEVILVEAPSYHGPFGAKGLGEAAIMPTAPAILNAVGRAIGRRVRRLPASAERVFQAISASLSQP